MLYCDILVNIPNDFKLHIKPNDFVIPICHEGLNRSQVLKLVLAGVKRQTYRLSGTIPSTSELHVAFPHGAESGFDPYLAYKDLTPANDMDAYSYIHGLLLSRFNPRSDPSSPLIDNPTEWQQKCFAQAFGVGEKSKRIGEVYAREHGLSGTNPDGSLITVLNPIDTSNQFYLDKVMRVRKEIRNAMNDILYNPDNLRACRANFAGQDEGRVIIFCFMRAARISFIVIICYSL